MKILKQAVVILLVASYSAIFGEFYVRIMRSTPMMPRYVTAAPYGVRMNVPGAVYWQTTPEVRVQIRINTAGIRTDREFPYQKPPGVCRVVVFGDSFFMGYEVELQNSFTEWLERTLREHGKPCEVVNLAVSGFGTAEMLVALQAEGLRYQPDIVIFQWHVSDPGDNLRSGLFTTRGGELVRASGEYLPAVSIRDFLSKFAVYRWLIENSRLYSRVRGLLAVKTKRLLVQLRRRQDVDDIPEEAGVAEVERTKPGSAPAGDTLDVLLLLEARGISKKNGAEFLLVDIPFRDSRVEFHPSLGRLPLDSLRGIEIVSPTSAFLAAADPNQMLYYEQGHGHLSIRGNEILQDEVAKKILTAGWLD